MIRAAWYKELMDEAGIPLTKTEVDLLDKMTSRRGKVQEQVYMYRLEKETSSPLTQNQTVIMEMLAWVEKAVQMMKKRNERKGNEYNE